MRLTAIPLLFLFFQLHFSFSQNTELSFSSFNPEMLISANAVIRNHQMQVNLLSKDEMLVDYVRTVTVLNEKGNKQVQAYVGYSNSVTVKNANANIYDKNGNLLKKVKKKDFLDVSAVDGGTLYSDSRVLYMGYLPTEYPYTVSFSYQLKTKNTGTIPLWYFIDGFLVSTEKTSYTISYADAALKPKVLERNLEDYGIAQKESPLSITYSAENLKALKAESLMPSMHKILPNLLVCPVNFYYEGFNGSVNDWTDAGNWMNTNLLNGQDILDPGTITMAGNLVSGIEDDLEKAKAIYSYVQENTRYISVQVGIGGLKPISAIEVDRVKYGDCKGLTNYTKALLKAVGVESYYVHVQAGKEIVDFEENAASFAQGNHVILAIPYNEKYYWVDCTSQVHPFGFLGDFTDNRKVLLMKPEGGEITTTDAYLNEDNLQETIGTYSLNDQGNLSGKVKIITKGIQYDQHFYLEGSSKLDIEKHYKNYWSNINNLSVNYFSFENDKDAITFEENLEVGAIGYASKSQDRLIFVANAFNNMQSAPPRYRNRKFPLDIQRGYMDQDTMQIDFPEAYKIESLPQKRELKTKFGEYAIDFLVEDGKIKVIRKILIKAGTYPSSDYGAYRNFKRTITKIDNSKVVLIKR
ncbi:DUF3857 domain-containing protein [Flagellimonas allohymeniacidonis]|uniref:DUF3857 domain-containing protein n=1 Tax=Flagellimonas allohymeniacidonis TaxID=2517819 RepID=A0A4V6MM92_9FLAO|nr:DUF3857 domain-containing protein [Allomuricauda hymeniacidonis]TAI46900.1 DUF3857 domain-containing protein [Allomuricauda hymeniacidonis]